GLRTGSRRFPRWPRLSERLPLPMVSTAGPVIGTWRPPSPAANSLTEGAGQPATKEKPSKRSARIRCLVLRVDRSAGSGFAERDALVAQVADRGARPDECARDSDWARRRRPWGAQATAARSSP